MSIVRHYWDGECEILIDNEAALQDEEELQRLRREISEILQRAEKKSSVMQQERERTSAGGVEK